MNTALDPLPGSTAAPVQLALQLNRKLCRLESCYQPSPNVEVDLARVARC
jgi:hypothetical protein